MSYKEETEDDVFEDRIRRAVAALYRVTDILSENEPLKWKLRNDATELMDTVVSLYQQENTFSQNYYNPLHATERLLSKISIITAGGGFISKLNFQVLEREYAAISDMLFQKMSDMRSKGQSILSDTSIGHYKRHVKDIMDTIKDKKDKPSIYSVADLQLMSKKEGKNPSSTNERQERITAALSGKGWLQIVDIAALCGGSISIKTVQRDLTRLVQNGLVQSKGERRWRSYTLAE